VILKQLLFQIPVLKNNITISIAYIYSGQNIIVKTIYYAVNVTTTKAKLFVIKYKVNQVV